MARMDPKRKLELGRRVALKEITAQQAAEEYGCHISLAWDARKKWLDQNTPKADPLGGPPAVSVSVNVKPAEDLVKRLSGLEDENTRLHDEVRVLQKIVMTLGRAL